MQYDKEIYEAIADISSVLSPGISVRMTRKGMMFTVRSSRFINGLQEKVNLGSFSDPVEAEAALAEFKKQIELEKKQKLLNQIDKIKTNAPSRREMKVRVIVSKIPKDVLEFLDWNINANPLDISGNSQIFVDQNGDPITVKRTELQLWWSVVLDRFPDPDSTSADANTNPKTNVNPGAARPATGPTKQQILQDLLDQREDLESQINEELAESYDEQDHGKIESLGVRVRELTELIGRVMEDAAAASQQAKDNEDPFSI